MLLTTVCYAVTDVVLCWCYAGTIFVLMLCFNNMTLRCATLCYLILE
jgi:hypothetical protein